jgi:tRNA 2-thiouridine synthesizing protein A
MILTADIEIDLSGLQCPMPLLKTKLALNGMVPDQILKVVATDPASEKDFQMFAQHSDNEILEFEKNESEYFYWIKKG